MRSDHDLYILLTDTGTYFTKMIKLFTGAPYNHVSVAFDAELKLLYSFGRKRPSNPLVAGFIEEDVCEGTYRRFPRTRCAVLRLGVGEREKAAAFKTIRSFQANRDAYRYNLIGLLGVLAGAELAPRNAYFCSQFAADVLARAGCRLWDRPPALVTPNDFRLHPAFELVYEGELFDYPLLDQDKVRDIRGVPVAYAGSGIWGRDIPL